MFDPGAGHRLFALPPGCDFPAELARGLIARMAGQPPEAMARVTLFVNTQRMRRRIGALLAAEGARFLPRLRLVTDLAPEAMRLGIAACRATNLADGRVEVLAMGEAAAIDALAGWLRQGPSLARVDSLMREDIDDADVPPGFGIA